MIMEDGQTNDEFSYCEKRLCILLFLSALPNSFATLQSLVTQYTPQHHCALTDVFDEFKPKTGTSNITENATARIYDMFIPFEDDSVGKVSRSQCHRYERNALFNLSQFNSKNVKAVLVISLISKFVSAVAWAVVYLHSTEVFPTKCRQCILTLLNISSRFGGILSQYLVHASESGSVLKPCLITSGLLFVACTLYLLIPETKNVPLPATIEDAVNMRSQFGLRVYARRKDAFPKAEIENLNPDGDNMRAVSS